MINLICGPNGSGKTQKLIDRANSELEKTDGLIVYIDRSNNHRIGIDTRIRFINAAEFDVDNADKLVGMLCGLIAGNYDINRIYIDNLTRMIGCCCGDTVNGIFSEIEKLVNLNNVEFTLTMNSEECENYDLSSYNFLEA